MRYFDRPFAAVILISILGSCLGACVVLVCPPVRGFLIFLIQTRVATPIRTVSQFGNGALFLLVFLNNSIPAALSFAYPFIIVKVEWTPALTQGRRSLLLASFTRLCAFLVGFFGIGVMLSIGWILGGYELLVKLLSGALIHGPLELVAVLLCVAEPLRLAEDRKDVDLRIILREDFKLLSACLLVLVLAAGLEVFIGL